MRPGAPTLILASYALAGALFATGTSAQTYFDPGPAVCLKPDGTQESCLLRQCKAYGGSCYEPDQPPAEPTQPLLKPAPRVGGTYFDPGTFPPKLSEQDLATLAMRPDEKPLPPPEYDYPNTGRILVVEAESHEQMRTMCRRPLQSPTLAGCADRGKPPPKLTSNPPMRVPETPPLVPFERGSRFSDSIGWPLVRDVEKAPRVNCLVPSAS
jgi:hypothetical protein